MATFGGGLNVLDTKTNQFKVYKSIDDNSNSISSDYLYSILKDSKGNIWMGTAGEGINRLDAKTQKINRFDTDANVRYQTVTAIIEDNKGLIWFSTKQGVNPATNILKIANANNLFNASFSIVDILGKTTVQSKALSNYAIDVSSLSSGVYVLSVSSEEGARQFKFQKK